MMNQIRTGNTEEYTTWLVVSCVVLATIFFYYYSSGKLKLKITRMMSKIFSMHKLNKSYVKKY